MSSLGSSSLPSWIIRSNIKSSSSTVSGVRRIPSSFVRNHGTLVPSTHRGSMFHESSSQQHHQQWPIEQRRYFSSADHNHHHYRHVRVSSSQQQQQTQQQRQKQQAQRRRSFATTTATTSTITDKATSLTDDKSGKDELESPPHQSHSVQQHDHDMLQLQQEDEEGDDLIGTNLMEDIPGTRVGGGRTLAIIYTCGVCETRSIKQFTERAYQHGVVMVQCPGCGNWHLIADHLGYFEEHFLQEQEQPPPESSSHPQSQSSNDNPTNTSTTSTTHWNVFQHLQQQQKQQQQPSNINAKVVTNDNVWELTVEDLMGTDKYQQMLDKAAANHNGNNNHVEDHTSEQVISNDRGDANEPTSKASP